MAEDHRVVVVGAGIGGLVSALLLASRGLSVTLVDSADAPGGKMRAVMVDGQPIDAGPTVFTMRWVFDELLAQVGSSLDELVQLTPLKVLARHAWRGHDGHLDLFADEAQSADAIARFSSPAEAARYRAFCVEAQKVYQALEGPHIRSQRPNVLGMTAALGLSGLSTLVGLGPFSTLWRTLGRRFQDPRLQQLFGRYATYCGASPWGAPATLMLVAHVEREGVWSIEGGLSHFARRLADLAVQRGVCLRLGTAVSRISVAHGRACGVVLSSGEAIDADSVVFNGDANALALQLLGQPAAAAQPTVLPPARRSLSALTWAMHARTEGFALERHNVFFDDDYASEFEDIFRRRRLPRHGTVYVCAQDRGGAASVAPGQPERLLALVNAPADGDQGAPDNPHHPFHVSEIQSCEQRNWALLQACGLRLHIEHPRQVQRRSPMDLNRLFPGSAGALYGPATHGWMALFKRSGARTPLPGLFLAGGSVHPGPGVPMAAMSGRLAAATLLERLDSTSRSRRVATSGGTSTPSVTTAATP
jgi:1-hydroxycarotenoid 3,4-desaturase